MFHMAALQYSENDYQDGKTFNSHLTLRAGLMLMMMTTMTMIKIIFQLTLRTGLSRREALSMGLSWLPGSPITTNVSHLSIGEKNRNGTKQLQAWGALVLATSRGKCSLFCAQVRHMVHVHKVVCVHAAHLGAGMCTGWAWCAHWPPDCTPH